MEDDDSTFDIIFIIAEFHHYYPGLFDNGNIGWKEFWELYRKIPKLRATHRIELFNAEVYGALLQSEKGQRDATKLYKTTEKEASILLSDAVRKKSADDPWEKLTAKGMRGEL